MIIQDLPTWPVFDVDMSPALELMEKISAAVQSYGLSPAETEKIMFAKLREEYAGVLTSTDINSIISMLKDVLLQGRNPDKTSVH